jgi:hypothetical protein
MRSAAFFLLSKLCQLQFAKECWHAEQVLSQLQVCAELVHEFAKLVYKCADPVYVNADQSLLLVHQHNGPCLQELSYQIFSYSQVGRLPHVSC